MGIKLVIVDDAPFIREALKNILIQEGFDCIGEAGDGAEAISLIKKLKPDLVLLDLVLPIKNGIDVCREIKEVLPSTKIIACSTEGEKSMMLKAIEAGCAEFIVKPFTKEQVLEKINQALGI